MTATLFNLLILTSITWPLLLMFMLTFKNAHSLLLYIIPWAALPGLATVIIAWSTVAQVELPWLLLGGSYALDETGKMFMLLAALLWTISGVYAKSYFNTIEEQVRFYRYFLLTMSGNFILILAQDLSGFYFGFTLMSFASYGLVVFKKDALSLKAGLVYITLVVVGEVMLFVAFLMATQAAESTMFSAVRESLIESPNYNIIILLAFAGFGIKVGILGLHVWLPLAHPVAPTPASAVLSGTIIKAGILGWLRFLPLGETALPDWGSGIIILGLASAFYGVVIGLTQRNPKTILAYSSISQMGVITILFGLGMLTPKTWPLILPGITFYVLHHGLSKGALFLGVGLCGSKHRIERRWVWLGLWLPALTLAGVPLTSGIIVKNLAKSYALHCSAPWETLLPPLLSISAVATALLMARLLYLLRPSAQPYGSTPVYGLVWPWIVLLIIIVLTPWSIGYSFEHPMSSLVPGSIWPLILSIIISITVYKVPIFHAIRPIPAGDLLVVFESALKLLLNLVKRLNTIDYLTIQQYTNTKINSILRGFQTKIGKIESALVRWEFGMFFILIIIFIAGFLAWGTNY